MGQLISSLNDNNRNNNSYTLDDKNTYIDAEWEELLEKVSEKVSKQDLVDYINHHDNNVNNLEGQVSILGKLLNEQIQKTAEIKDKITSFDEIIDLTKRFKQELNAFYKITDEQQQTITDVHKLINYDIDNINKKLSIMVGNIREINGRIDILEENVGDKDIKEEELQQEINTKTQECQTDNLEWDYSYIKNNYSPNQYYKILDV
jgi:ABC-type transporter Mla subunit MlaD